MPHDPYGALVERCKSCGAPMTNPALPLCGNEAHGGTPWEGLEAKQQREARAFRNETATRCAHTWKDGARPRCALEEGHPAPHLYRCVEDGCPGLDVPASVCKHACGSRRDLSDTHPAGRRSPFLAVSVLIPVRFVHRLARLLEIGGLVGGLSVEDREDLGRVLESILHDAGSQAPAPPSSAPSSDPMIGEELPDGRIFVGRCPECGATWDEPAREARGRPCRNRHGAPGKLGALVPGSVYTCKRCGSEDVVDPDEAPRDGLCGDCYLDDL